MVEGNNEKSNVEAADAVSRAMISRAYQKGYADCADYMQKLSAMSVRVNSSLGVTFRDLVRKSKETLKNAEAEVSRLMKKAAK